MSQFEKALFRQLLKLKNEFGVVGVKAEFEAEGASLMDLVRLRRLTARADVKLMLKIGGVEAMRDIKDALEIGVDGLIAPMVESPFGVAKFYEGCKKIYKGGVVHKAINIETKNAVRSIDQILDYAAGKINSITIGRTDLSASYFDVNIIPDCDAILDIVGRLSHAAKAHALKATVGGSISRRTIEAFNRQPQLAGNLDCIETRKVILPAEVALHNPLALKEALLFEKLHILYKKELTDLFIEEDIQRLTQLEGRI
ncbi:MAG: aldolase/citrate lyase family protein [Candidatus Omnitrophota bacterium]